MDAMLGECKARVEPLRAACAIRTEGAAERRAAALLRDVGSLLEALVVADYRGLPDDAPPSLHVAPRTETLDLDFAKKVHFSTLNQRRKGESFVSLYVHAYGAAPRGAGPGIRQEGVAP